MSVITATDIYNSVHNMRTEALNRLEADDVLYGDPTAYMRVEEEAKTLGRVLQMLEDDFGVMRPWPSLTAHLHRTGYMEEA